MLKDIENSRREEDSDLGLSSSEKVLSFANEAKKEILYHNTDATWLLTPLGDKRGYIQPKDLQELWIHTGTLCNLSCPFCFEGASSTSKRIETIDFEDARPLIDEALSLGVRQFSFTGGEPFMNQAFIKILEYALDSKPCLVLTNATKPIEKYFETLKAFVNKKNNLSFRVSLDFPNKELHDKNRGEGNFERALANCKNLISMGFHVSIAAQMQALKANEVVEKEFRTIFKAYGLDENLPLVLFPDLHLPCQSPTVPFITESCMTSYKTEYERDKFMCSHSSMLAKKNGKINIYPCTLVDDDDDYNMGNTLKEALKYRVMLRHHRCFACFSTGTSCSEL